MKTLYSFIVTLYSISIVAQNNLVIFQGNICENENTQYVLVFEDDFNGNSLDMSKWITFYPYGDNGSDQCSYCRTHSTDDIQEGQIYKDENVRVENGSLFLDIKKENASWYQFDKNYTSGMIHSKQTFNTYSKYEIRCKIPNGTGYWPAFWMFGWSTEIDVFELYEISDEFESAVRFWNDGEAQTIRFPVDTDINLSSAFHTYLLNMMRIGLNFILMEA